MTPYLVYQAYGRLDILRQTLFSIVSLLRMVGPTSPLHVVVYTDNKKFFTDFYAESSDRTFADRVTLVEISADTIKKWRGAIDFVHRVKVEVLIDTARRFDGPLFYVDGDTYFISDPTPTFNAVDDRHSLMHVAEYQIASGRDPLAKKMRRFLAKAEVEIAGEKVKVLPEHYMYNAGVLGISQKNRELLPLILEFTDKMFVLYGKHVIEQLAFSYYLQTRTEMRTCDDVIGHYWNQKDQFQTAIDEFLEEFTTWDRAKAAYPKQFHWPALHAIAPKRSIGATIREFFGLT